MAKKTTTLTLDERVLRALHAKARRTGATASDVIDAALRRELGLDLIESMSEAADLSEPDALRAAIEAQHNSRGD